MKKFSMLGLTALTVICSASETLRMQDFRDIVAGNEQKVIFSEAFEDRKISEKQWQLKGAVFNREGFNGNGGLTIQRKAFSDPYRITKARIALKPGKRYSIRVDVQFKDYNGPDKLSFFGIEFQKDKKYHGGVFPSFTGIKKVNSWKTYSAEFSSPSDMEAADVVLFLRKYTTGRATYDNIVIEELGEASPRIYPVLPKNLTVDDSGNITLHLDNVPAGKNCLLAEAQGKAVCGEIINGECTIQMPWLNEGRNVVRCAVVDPAQKIRYGQTEIILFRNRRAPGGITTRRNGIIERDGKAFLPVGIYCNADRLHESDLRRIADAGFNFILPYNSSLLNLTGKSKTRLDGMKTSFDMAARHGLQVLCCIKEIRPLQEMDGVKGYDKVIDYLVSGMKSHPALIGWYISDEEPIEHVPRFIRLRERISAIDNAHPVFTLTDKKLDARVYGATGDIFMGDFYPIRNEKDQSMTPLRDYITTCMSNGLGFWRVPQAFNWGITFRTDPYSSYRYPTDLEMRSMVLLAMNLGTKGYCFYSYTPIFHQQEQLDPGSSKKFWPQVARTAKLLRELEPFFLTEQAENVKVDNQSEKFMDKNGDAHGKPFVEAKRYTAGGRTVVVITSDGPGHARAVLELPDGKQFKSRFGQTRSLGGGKYLFEGDNICSDILE